MLLENIFMLEDAVNICTKVVHKKYENKYSNNNWKKAYKS